MITWQGMLHDMNCHDIDHELLCFEIGSGGVRPMANFIWMSSDECVSGLVQGHLVDDPRGGRGL